MITRLKIKPELSVQRLAELGLDEDEIIHSLGLKRNEFEKLKEEKKICSALEKGRDECARKVEQALYRRATGFEYEETVTSEKPEKQIPPSDKPEHLPLKKGGIDSVSYGAEPGKTTKSSSRLTLKTVIPDVSACIFWLKNRMPDKWRDPKEIETNRKKSIQDLVEEYEAKGFEEDD